MKTTAAKQTQANPSETVLLISGKVSWLSRFNIESAGLSLCDLARKGNGDGWAGWLPSGAMQVRLHGMSLEDIHILMDAFFVSAVKAAESVSVAERQAAAAPLPDINGGDIPWGTVIRQPLTKTLLTRP
jgi:hypothetical protein